MNTTPIQQRGMFFRILKEQHSLSQQQIREYCLKKYDQNFSPSTISRGIKEAELIDKVQERELQLHELVPEVDKELLTVVIKDSCVRKFRKS